MAGSGLVGAAGLPGPAPDASPPNLVGAGATWVDAQGRLWLFGGFQNGAGVAGTLGDLWRFDGTGWTLLRGPGRRDDPSQAHRGTRGLADPANFPTPRYSAVTWVDRAGAFWMYGGVGYDDQGQHGTLGDLWRFDGSLWTWMGGPTSIDPPASYGSKGVAAEANQPVTVGNATAWPDGDGGVWVFGGQNIRSWSGQVNDLWHFDGARWTWVSGSARRSDPGEYGTLGVPAPGNLPPARWGAAGWRDADGLWLFGGYFYDGSRFGDLNDLWRFDGATWTWMGGSDGIGAATVAGTLGVPAPGNVPGARRQCATWTDARGSLWLFGGGVGLAGEFNELWRLDARGWAWMGGSLGTGGTGVYGARWEVSQAYTPGARIGSTFWSDPSGVGWVLGGLGLDRNGQGGGLDDLWRHSAPP
jgi:hypothetical protein